MAEKKKKKVHCFMSQWRWQSACLEGTKQTRLNSREPQTDGIYRIHLRAEGLVPPRGRRRDLQRERREGKSTEARGACMNKRDPSGNRDVRGSKEVRDGGLQVRVC